MKIKQDPVTKLWCGENGAVCMPPSTRGGMHYRWTFGTAQPDGYRRVQYKGKTYRVHQIICRAFHGLPPEGKPEVDHISRVKDDNRSCNLRYADSSLNNTNKDYVDLAFEKHGVRSCEDKKSYDKVYGAAYAAKMKALGLTKRKGPDGKWGWYPFKRA